MQERAEQILRQLEGKPLCNAGRNINLVWFHFGAKHIVHDSKGIPIEVGDYALHIQCSWRIVHREKF